MLRHINTISKVSKYDFFLGKNYEQHFIGQDIRCEASDEIRHDGNKKDINQCKNECDMDTNCKYFFYQRIISSSGTTNWFCVVLPTCDTTTPVLVPQGSIFGSFKIGNRQ